MPDRPPPPGFITTLNDIERRLRDTERQVLLPAQDDDAVQVLEDGNVLGPVDYLDFGANLHAVLIGDRYVRIDAPASALQFDAVVDGNAGVTDEAARVFLGIGEALAYLHSLGMQSVNVLVRNKGDYSASGLENYTETADFDSPYSVRLFGLRGGYDADVNLQNETGISWDMAGFRPISDIGTGGRPNFWIHGFSEFSVGNQSSQPFEVLDLDEVDCNWLTMGLTAQATRLVARNSSFQFNCAGIGASEQAYFFDCDLALRSGSTGAFAAVLAQQYLYFRGRLVNGQLAGTQTITLPTTAHLDLRETGFNRNFANNWPYALTLPAGFDGSIRNEDEVPVSGNTVEISAASQVGNCIVKGTFGPITFTSGGDNLNIDARCGNLTVGSPSANNSPAIIRGQVQGNIDVGHSHIDLTIEGAARTVTLRSLVTGFINSRAFSITSGAFLNYVSGASFGHLVVGLNEANASGTAIPYAFAAGANDNLLIMMGLQNWPNAGTDAGSRNLVFPEDFGGGSPPVAGHVIEDEGTPLTQRANINFTGAGVTATDSAPDTVVTIPGVGTPTAGWGSITNVTTDRVYDANASTLDELLDVVGTLIADLVAQGVLAN